MSHLADYLRRPITIQNREVILVPDLVGAVPISEQHQYVEIATASTTFPAIHAREVDIEDMRDRYPGYPVYGLWQTLVKSGLVSLKRTLQVVPITDEDGYYIHCDLGRAEYSGIYEAGFFAADAGFNLDEASAISAALDQLVLPDSEAKLASELQHERQMIMRKGWSYLVLCVVAIVALAFATDYTLSSVYNRHQQDIKSKNAMLQDLQHGLDRLRTTRLTEVPNNQKSLEQLAVLWRLFPSVQSDSKQSFKNKEMKFRLLDEGTDPAEKIDWVQSRYDPNGVWYLQFKLQDRS